jgi:hypothetical protein
MISKPSGKLSECPTTLVERLLLHYGVRTKPLARQTLRVLVGRGVLFDRCLRPFALTVQKGYALGDAPYLECSQ